MRTMLWATAAFMLSMVVVWSQGDPLGQQGNFEPTLPLLFFLACLSGFGGLASAALALLFGVLASFWRAPLEEGTGLSP